jgi:branched-subunit amino acid transport protein
MNGPHTVLSPAELLIAIVCMAAVTFGLRLFFIVVFGRYEMPALLRRSLRYVPPAVLSALVLPDLLYHGAALDISLTNHRLIAGIVAAAAAWRSRNVAVTIAIGMAVLIALNAIK